ncbi:hypothetical protein Hanom_Chr13g01240821 [Helianthus anomalus]
MQTLTNDNSTSQIFQMDHKIKTQKYHHHHHDFDSNFTDRITRTSFTTDLNPKKQPLTPKQL